MNIYMDESYLRISSPRLIHPEALTHVDISSTRNRTHVIAH